MHCFRLLTTSLASILLFSCGGSDSTAPLQVADRAILEVEDYRETVATPLLEWLLVELDDDFGAAARLVARDDAAWSENGLPTLTYDIDFPRTGNFELSLRGRQDSTTGTSEAVYLTFGEDSGDVVWTVSGLDDQWSWYNTDSLGRAMVINVATAGVHQFQISSASAGLLLDQVDIKRVANDSLTRPNTDSNPQPPVTTQQQPTDQNDSGTDTEDATDSALTPNSANQSPSASISGETVTIVGRSLILTASASDDGRPHGGLYYFWTKTAGPGTTSFSSILGATTEVSFDQPGTYTVQVTVSDGVLYSNTWHQITVAEPADSDSSQNEHQIQSFAAWHTLSTRGKVQERHETGGVVVDDKLYMIGGRGQRPVEVFDPENNSWTRIANTPMEMHHFQPVAIGTKIYVVGAFTCCYPREDIIENVYIFDTVTHQWSKGPRLPTNRKRGGGGATVYDGKIYLLGGNTRGHSGGAVNWFDEFDPATGRWTVLADAPDARDHVTIAVSNGKLVVAGGRKTNTPIPFANTVARTNVYDFNTGSWSNAASIPTERAGTMTVAFGNDVIIIGGESMADTNAHRNVEAFDTVTGMWRRLPSLDTGRHGGAAGILQGEIHVVAGNITRGGGRETSAHEVLR